MKEKKIGKKRENHCDRKIAYLRGIVNARGNKYQIEEFNRRYGR